MTTKTLDQVRTFRKDLSKWSWIVAEVRHDDRCGNGHNSFGITADLYENGVLSAGGCLHNEVAEHFPDLAPLLKWHLCSTDGPMHYIQNTTYLAGDRDCWGWRKGEHTRDRDGKLMWQRNRPEGSSIVGADDEPEDERIGHTPILGEGKEPDLDAARRSAIWPDATLEQLTDAKALEDRLPALMEDFRAAVEGIGLTY
jgi:hypothetical protein